MQEFICTLALLPRSPPTTTKDLRGHFGSRWFYTLAQACEFPLVLLMSGAVIDLGDDVVDLTQGDASDGVLAEPGQFRKADAAEVSWDLDDDVFANTDNEDLTDWLGTTASAHTPAATGQPRAQRPRWKVGVLRDRTWEEAFGFDHEQGTPTGRDDEQHTTAQSSNGGGGEPTYVASSPAASDGTDTSPSDYTSRGWGYGWRTPATSIDSDE